MTKRPEHCTAPSGEECWECTQPRLRVSERRINRVIKLVKGRSLQTINDTEYIAKLESAVRKLRDLHNAQWREMVRTPWKHQVQETKISTTGKRTTADLLADIGL